ncbi:MAG: hypothetical protein RIT28_3119 [Pseudomonadota bacterium]
MAPIFTLLGLLSGVAHAQEDDNGPCVDLGVLYEDVTEASGAVAYGNSLGVSMNDIDGDGDVDLYVASGPSRVENAVWYSGESLLYLNDGDLTFTEVGALWGVDDQCEDRAPMFGDLDNDGLHDLYVTVNGRNLYLHNTGQGRFEDLTFEAGAAGHGGWGHQGFLFDYDHDGFLDVFFTNGPEDGSGENTLLRNQGDGTFADATDEAGVAGDPSGKGACVLDADLDGWPDIFVPTGREFGNHLYMNQGDGSFRDEAHGRGVGDPEQRFGVGTVCEDFDNDGDPDILLVTHDKVWTGNQLFRNDGGAFVDVGPASGLAEWLDGHGLGAADINLDGLLDVVMSGIKTQPYVFLNQGGMRFERACDGAGIQQTEGVTWAVVGGDMTNDGYPEVLISNGLGRRPRANALFRHLGGDAHFLTVEVQGVSHNPSALGAKVEARIGETVLTRWVGAWSSFDSQGPLAITFGLGDNTVVDELTVTFTNGVVQTMTQIAADQALVVAEEVSRPDADHDGVPDEWDLCPATRLGQLHDADGCAAGQRAGLPLGLVSPEQDAVLTVPPTFRWEGEFVSAVVQVSTDGTFGAASRFDFGPYDLGGALLTDADWAALLEESDGSRALLWRVVAVGENGETAVTAPRRFYASQPTEVVSIPFGANLFVPAHIVIPLGTTVTWWNDPVSAGNLQAEPHDIQLIDSTGLILSPMAELNAAGVFTWTFDTVGQYHYLCQRHSGPGWSGDMPMESGGLLRADGPFRCMAGTVTVR